jgi:hypothetical protein
LTVNLLVSGQKLYLSFNHLKNKLTNNATFRSIADAEYAKSPPSLGSREGGRGGEFDLCVFAVNEKV